MIRKKLKKNSREYVSIFSLSFLILQTVAKKFVDGEIEVDEFLEQYLSLRKLVHLRKVKVEKMQELIKAKDRGSVGYPMIGKFPGMSPSLPYPSGIVSMPMPVQMPPY